MWDESTLSLYVQNERGTFSVRLPTVSVGPMKRVERIPETATRWEPLMTIPRILCADAITAAVRRAESEIIGATALRTTVPEPWGDGQ